MMNPPILISMDSNERESARATALALAAGSDPTYHLTGFVELPVDLRICHGEVTSLCPRYCVNIELKEISDFWASKNTGHLGQQIMTMIAEGQPGFVAVFGSLQDTMDQIPKVKSDHGRVQKRTHQDIATDENTARALCADAMTCNVPIFFLSPNYMASFKWILSMAKNILHGSSMASWLPRFPVDPKGYSVLCSICGIGDVAAEGLLKEFGDIATICQIAQEDPDVLAECKVNGKRLGKAKAAKLIEVFG